MNFSTVARFLFLLFVVFTLPLEARTWTSSDGKSIEAEFISANIDSVTIKRSDGRKFVLPLSRLSQADQIFIADRLKSNRSTDPMSPASGDRNSNITPKLTIDSSRAWVPVIQNIESIVRSAREKPVEDLLEPVRSVRYCSDDNIVWAPNPDGKTWDIIPFYYNGYGGEMTAAILDFGSGEQKIENHPRGLNWHLCPYVLAPNGKVYISIRKSRAMGVCIYDPAKNHLKMDAVSMPEGMAGETHPIVRATDGMLFVGGSHSSKASGLIMIDPKNDSVTDFGACGPSHAPASCYTYYMGADDTHVYLASGKVPWNLIAVDRETKKSKVLAKTASTGGMVVVSQEVHGVAADVSPGGGKKKQRYWCHKGELVPRSESCPWGKTGTDWEADLPPKPELYTELILPEQGKQAEVWVKEAVPNVEPDSGFPGWSKFQYDVPLYPMRSHRLTELPDGRIFGTAGSYHGNYIYDPASGECSYMGKISLSHYATAIHDNKVWMSGYPSSQLYVFDCAKPWNVISQGVGPGTQLASIESSDSNPRLLGRLAESRCHKMYGAAVGASGDIYFGGRWMRTGNGGGFGWWNPKTNEEGGLWEEFSAQQVGFLCSSGDGKYIVISTKKVNDIVLKKPTPDEGKLFIFDDAKKKIISEVVVEEGADGPGPIVWAGGNRVIGWTGRILYGVDVEKGEVIWKEELPFDLPIEIGSNQEEDFDFRLGPDGWIWTFGGENAKTLVRINPETVEFKSVAEVGRAGRLAFSGSDVYLSGTNYLRRLKGVLKED